jgi:transglutaminase-like putative cysteine protease
MARSVLVAAVTLLLCTPPAMADEPRIPGRVLSQRPAPECCPMGMAFDGEHLWVADRKVNKLLKLDRTTGEVVTELPTPGYRPTGLAWDGHRLWVADRDTSELFALDPADGTVDRVNRIPVRSPRGLAWDGECLYVADARKDLILCLDPSDGTMIRSFQAPHGAVTGLTYDGTYLWAADRRVDEIYRIDPRRGHVVGIIPSPGPHPWGLAWDGECLWNGDYQTRRLYCLDTEADDPKVRLGERKLQVQYTVHFLSQGPDPVKTADFFFAVPGNRYNQQLIGDVRFSHEGIRHDRDRWGQEILIFHVEDLAPGTHLQPTLTVDVQLFDTRFWLVPEKVQPLSTVDRSIREAYLADGRKLRLNHPAIRKAAAEAVGDETNPYWRARNLYQYVLEKLDYRLSGGWESAPLLLERGTGSCSEYSFIFIALCRAAGIPARYVGGIVTRGDDAFVDNMFHRWVEIYLPGYGWIPVDPDRGDKRTPRGQALGFGSQASTMLVTTVSGGESEWLEWRYNANVKWTFKGHARAYIEHIGELSPLNEQPLDEPLEAEDPPVEE